MEAGIEAVEALVRPARPVRPEAPGNLELGYEQRAGGARSRSVLVPVPSWTPKKERRGQQQLETASQVKQKPQDGPWGCFVALCRSGLWEDQDSGPLLQLRQPVSGERAARHGR